MGLPSLSATRPWRVNVCAAAPSERRIMHTTAYILNVLMFILLYKRPARRFIVPETVGIPKRCGGTVGGGLQKRKNLPQGSDRL
jgi:hypothetical protein